MSRKLGHGACGAALGDDGSQALARAPPLRLSLTLLLPVSVLQSPALRPRSSNSGATTVLTWAPSSPGGAGWAAFSLKKREHFRQRCPRRVTSPSCAERGGWPASSQSPQPQSPHPEASELFLPRSASPPEAGARVGSVFSSVCLRDCVSGQVGGRVCVDRRFQVRSGDTPRLLQPEDSADQDEQDGYLHEHQEHVVGPARGGGAVRALPVTRDRLLDASLPSPTPLRTAPGCQIMLLLGGTRRLTLWTH